VGVQEVKLERGSNEPAGYYIFFYENWNDSHELGTQFFVHKEMLSVVEKVEFVSDRM
jgi:hypothetical protein